MNIRQAHTFSNKVVDALIKERQRKNITKYQISKNCGISEAALSYIERHERHPTLYTLKMIADAIGINLSDIIKDIENSSQ